MDSLWRDLRHAVRGLISSPGFALTVVLSVGLGVGANTTVFAWMDNIVRNPFPGIPRGGELVALNVAEMDGRVEGMPPIAYPVLEEWRARTTLFAGIAAHAQARLNLRPSPSELGEPVWVEITSANFFDTVAVVAGPGRVFNTGDEAASAAVVVLSHAFWLRRFGGALDAIGRSVLFNGVPLTIVGIAPPRFTGVVMGLGFDAWVPVWQQSALIPGADWMRDRTARRMQAVARLRPGATLLEANQELNGIARDVSRSFGESPLTGASARWISDTQLGSLLGPLSLAMIAVTAVVLLTACSNVAGLLLARSVSRERQTAIQVAVGALRSHLFQQSLVQAAILAALGCALGLLIAQITKGALTAFVPRVALPVSLEIDLNWRVHVFAAAVSVVAALLFALLPTLRASHPNIADVLKSSSGAGSARRSLIRKGLIVAQVSLSLVSLVIAGLFLRSVAAAGRVPLGIGDASHVLLVSTDLSFTRLQGDPLVSLVDRALDAVRRLPGVTHASFSTMVPLSFGGPPRVNSRIEGYVPAPNESMFIARASVSDGYFETMEIPIVEGRAVTVADRQHGLRAVVVNEALVARYWPGQSGLGQRIDQGDGWATIVGVARNIAIDSVKDPPRPLVYHPWAQSASTALTLHVRTRTDPLALAEPVRRQLAAVHADLPALEPGTLADHMHAATFVQSVGAAVFSVFGLVALAIATVGLYGVVAQFVAEHRREIAVIVALGATPRIVASAVVRPALGLTLIGLGSGAVLGAAGATLLRNQLVGIAAIDVVSIAGGVALVVIAALASCVWPTWRAIRVDPLAAIREQ
jgi:predicted permease